MPPTNTAAVQAQAFQAANTLVRQVNNYQREAARRIPPIQEEVRKGLRGLDEALRQSQEVQGVLRAVVGPDWDVLGSVLLGRDNYADLQREAQSTLQLLQAAQSFRSRIRDIDVSLTRSRTAVGRISLPSSVNSCSSYTRLGSSRGALKESLQANVTLLRQASRALSAFWEERNQIVRDLLQAISLGLRMKNLTASIHSNKGVILTALRVGGYGVWGWRLVGMSESRWRNKSRRQKDDAFYSLVRSYKQGAASAYTGLIGGQRELTGMLEEIPQLKADIGSMGAKARSALSTLNSSNLPPICPAPAPAFGGLSPSSMSPSPAALVVGGLAAGFAVGMLWHERTR
jgi:hypothetical protein